MVSVLRELLGSLPGKFDALEARVVTQAYLEDTISAVVTGVMDNTSSILQKAMASLIGLGMISMQSSAKLNKTT